MPNQTILVQYRDALVIHVTSGGDLIANGETLENLVVETDKPPVRIDAVDPNGVWVFNPTGAWESNPSGPGIYAELEHTDGDEFESHDFEIAPASDPEQTRPKPLPIKIKPISEGPDGLS